MGASDLVKTLFLFKKTYSSRPLPETLKRVHPWLMKIKKSFDWTGENDFRYPVKDANPQGIGGTYTGAVANNTDGSQGNQFIAARRKRYGKGTIDGEALRASRNDNGAFVRLVTHEVDGHLAEHTDTLAHGLFRDGSGMRGQVSAVAGNLITLTRQDDVRWFKRTMKLISSTSATGVAPRAGTMKVTKVDYGNSQITVDTIVVGTAPNDFLFRNTEQADTASGGAPAMDGMQSIIPQTPGTFRSVDQTVDRERYAGWFINDPNTSLEDNAAELITRINSYGGVSDNMLLVCSPRQALVVCKRQNAKVEFDGGGDEAYVGFGTFRVLTPMGMIRCMPDADCPVTDFFVVTPESWELKCLDQPPHIIMDDENRVLRDSAEDSLEYRSRSMVNLICYAPVLNGRGLLNAV